MLNKYCIVRTYSAGVFAGEVATIDKKVVVVKNARRLWEWKTKKGISLSEIALFGVDERGSKICYAVPEVMLTEAIEIIPASEEAKKSLDEVKGYEYNEE